MPDPGGKFGDYTIVRLLGKGGMGAVWLLRADDGREVAAKILDPSSSEDREARKRFLREAQLALGVRHTNLVATYDVGEDPETGLCYILMEYMPGGTLADYLKANGKLSIEDAVAVVRAMADVLELGRQKGVVHRDIKPANIMFDADGTPKLADLGIARGSAAGVETTTVTQTGMMIGTPAYMAPEQMLDAHNVDTRADIYSLGVVFFEMLTGERPNKDDTVVQLMAKAVKGEPLPDVRTLRPEVSAALAQLLNMMVAPDKDGRISTPGQITNALGIIERGGDFVGATPASGRARTPTAPPSAERRAFFRCKALVPIGILGALVAVFVFLVPKREPARRVVTTNVVERVVEKVNVMTNIVHFQGGTAAVGKVKDGKYTCETPEGEWSYHVRDGKAWLGGDERPALYPLPVGRLELPVSLNGIPIAGVARRAFYGCTELKEVVIPEGYGAINRDAFCDCKSLECFRLPKSMRIIDSFAVCNTKIRSLDLNRTSEWNWNTIAGTPYLDEIRFDPRNASFVVVDGLVLSKDRKQLLFVPRGRTDPVIPATVTFVHGQAFSQGAVRSLVIPEGVHEIHMFAASKCDDLQRLVIGRGVQQIGKKAFEFATNLVELTFEEGIRHLDEWAVFSHCSSLRELNLPESLETVGPGVFEDATSLERVRFGRSLRRIGYRSFGGDTALKTAAFPSSLREMCAECFKNCRVLRQVSFDGDAPELIDNDEGQRGVDVFMGTPRDLVICVKRGSKGWNPGGEGLPDKWPVGAGGNARRIRYRGDTVADVDGKTVEVGVRKLIPTKERLSVNAAQLNDPDSTRAVQKTLDALFPGWKTSETGGGRELGYRAEHRGEAGVLCSHPPRMGVPVTFSKDVAATGECPVLHLRLSNHRDGRHFRLRVKINRKIVREKEITDGWTDVYVDLSKWKGKTARVELDHLPSGWCQEWAYWSAIEVVDDRILTEVAKVQELDRPVKLFDHEKIEGTDVRKAVQRTCDVLFPGWKVSDNGHLGETGYEEEFCDRYNNLLTHPPGEDRPVVLSRNVRLPRGNPKLYVSVANQPDGDFELQVKVNGKVIARPDIMGEGWKDLAFDMRPWAGRQVKLELLNMPTGWQQEWAHWNRIEVK